MADIPTQGSVVIADMPPAAPPPPEGAPVVVAPPQPFVVPAEPVAVPPPSPQETLVVPMGSTLGANPFIPQGGAPQTAYQPPSAGGSIFRRLLMIVVFLIVLGFLAFGGLFVWNKVKGGGNVTLTYWGLWENSASIQSVLNDFHAKNPNVTVEYAKQSPQQYRERVSAQIENGAGPDVFRFHNTWVPMFRSDLAVAPKEIMTVSEFTSTFYPVAQADLIGGSSIYGMPLMIDGLGLYYNEDVFAAAGITGPPTTWEELLSMVPKIAKADGTGFSVSAIALGTTNNVENFSDIVATMMMQNGADLTNPTGKEAEEALVFYRKFATPSDPVYTWNETLDNSINAFATGKVAMILAPSWRAFDIKQMNPTLRFKIAPIPQLPGTNVTWGSYWVEGVSAKTKHPKEAWEFVKFLTSRETATKLYTEAGKNRLFGEPYARVDLASSLQDDPYVGAYIKQAPQARSFPLASRTFDNGLNDKLIKYLEDAINSVIGGAAPSAALQTATAGFRQVLGTYGLTSNAVR